MSKSEAQVGFVQQYNGVTWFLLLLLYIFPNNYIPFAFFDHAEM